MTLVNLNQRPAAKNYDHLFNELFNGFSGSWGHSEKGAAFAPAANIYETAQAYHVDLNAPGRSKEDFKVNIEKDLLTISYEKKEEQKAEGVNAIRREFNFNSFKRSFSLDEKVNTTGVNAKYENGILKIELPKKEEVKEYAKQIAIN
ncbi:MAG: Hsp20/alpha crystallin family protein [Flavitalea sp.]